MYAKKANRQYVIAQGQEDAYKAMGYDIYDDEGKLIARGAGKTVSFAKYEDALKEIEALKKKLADTEKKLKATTKE